MARISKFMLAACGAATLAACGSGGDGGKSGDAAATSEAGPSGWNAADACSIVDKAAVADVLKTSVADTQLGMVHEADAASAATSECSYLGEDGATVARLMTRWSPVSDNTPTAIESAKSASAAALKGFSDKPLEDVPGLGKAAFFVPVGLPSLTVFIDDARMVTITIETTPDGISGKDATVALAKKAGA